MKYFLIPFMSITQVFFCSSHRNKGYILKQLINKEDRNGIEQFLNTCSFREIEQLQEKFSLLPSVLWNQKTTILTLLLEKGFNPNKRFYKGHLPLHIVIKQKNYEHAVLLVEAGARISLRDRAGTYKLINEYIVRSQHLQWQNLLFVSFDKPER